MAEVTPTSWTVTEHDASSFALSSRPPQAVEFESASEQQVQSVVSAWAACTWDSSGSQEHLFGRNQSRCNYPGHKGQTAPA
uniref:Uncharacterized protein n=1 Tax=Knipowitschia caucasica TaxID=637954 RepID=A0AAV2JY89_KNICA